MTQLSISLLGPFQVTLNNGAMTHFASDSARALLAYLMMHPDTAHRRDALAGLLWPEHPNAEALRNLRVVLSRLRDAIGDREAGTPFLEVTRRTIQINLDAHSALDVQRMREALAVTKTHSHPQIDPCDTCAKQLEKVASLYRGEFFSGFAFDSAPFEEWMVVERENLHWQALEALYALANYHEKQGNYPTAIAFARRQVELESWREPAHRQWMRALALSGHRSAALAQFDICRKILSEELGVEPEIETVTLYERIRDGNLAPPQMAITEPANIDLPVEIPFTPPATALVEAKEPLQQPDHPQIPDGERRTVTIVQAEVQGTDAPMGLDNKEDYATMMSQLLRAAGAEIHLYGGEVDHYDASGLIAFFGAQTTHEDDPERGVLAALAMQKVFQAQLLEIINEPADKPGSPTKVNVGNLDLRVAVHTGDTIVTVMDGEGKTGRRMVMGDTVLSTSRMLAKTPQGEVLVSETTYHLTSPLFKWEFEDDGIGYIPLTSQMGTDKEHGMPGMRSTLVGRELEFQALREVIDRLESGIGGIVTLVGEAGIGKSRLVAEIRESANLPWVEGRCLSYSGTMAYALWQSILRALLGVTADTPPAIIGYTLRKHMHSFDMERFKLHYACLGKLLSMPMDAESEALVTQMDAENLKNATYYAVELLLESTAQQQPLVIVCEDLHWADQTSLALLERLLYLTDHSPLLIICIFRPERTHGCWQIRETALRMYPHRHIDIMLKHLTTTDSEKLLVNLLLSLPGPDGRKPVEGLPDALKTQILNRGEGNPFFVEEILRTLIRGGVIICDNVTCQWQTPNETESISIPVSLYGVLRARIDQLPKNTRRVLELAAVIGRIFPYTLLADIAEQQSLDEHLVILQQEQMIRERAHLPEAEYIFQHQLTLEAVYGGLLHRVQRVLHRRVASALERLYPDRIAEQLGLLAYHWEQSGDSTRAVEYLHRAGEQAAAQYANDEAVDYLSRALDLIPQRDLDDRYAMLSVREAVYDMQGKREAQREDLTRLRDIAGDLNDGSKEATRRLAEVALRQANFYDHIRDRTALADAAQQAVRYARAAGDKSIEAEGHLQWGTALHRSWENEQSGVHWEKALTLARAAGQRYQEARVLRELGLSSDMMGEQDAAKTYLEQNLQIHRESCNRMEEGRALNALGLIIHHMHDLSGAKAYIEDGLRLCRLVGNRLDEAYALGTLGFILFDLGMYAASENRLQEAISLFRQIDDIYGEDVATVIRSWIAHIMGDDDASQSLSEHALRSIKATKTTWSQDLALISLGDALASKTRWSDAYRAYKEALTLCQDHEWHHRAVSAQAGLARVALRQEKLEEAMSYVHKILEYIGVHPELNGTYDPMRVYLTCFRVLRAAGDPRANDILRTAYNQLQMWADKIDDEDLRRSFLKNIAEHREIAAIFKQNT